MSNPDTERMLSAGQPGAGGTQFAGWIGPGADSAVASLLQRLQATGQLKFSTN